MSRRPRRIGLLGGSFNPAHAGHRGISLAAIEALGLDEMWWLVSPGNPLKPAVGMAPLSARLASARRMARAARIRPTDIEARLGTRDTVDTLAALVASPARAPRLTRARLRPTRARTPALTPSPRPAPAATLTTVPRPSVASLPWPLVSSVSWWLL